MAWSFTVYALPPLVSTALAAGLAYEGWRNRQRAIARPFVVLMATIAVWSLAYAIQLGFQTQGAQLFWSKVGTTLGATVPVTWLVLTAIYAGYEEWASRERVAVLSAEPVALAVLLWSNHLHGLVWRDVRFDPRATPAVVDPVLGPAFVAHLAFAYLLVVVGIGLLLKVLVRSGPVYRRQSALLVVGAVVLLAANVASTLGYSPVQHLDLTTATFTITGVVFGLALFRFDLLNLTPVARRQLLTEFGGGLVVVDADDRVVEFNQVAGDALPELERVGQDFGDIFAVDAIGDLGGRVVTADVGDRNRAYEVGVSTLEDYRGTGVGKMVVLQDVTDRREYEQRLEVANRLLRHNIRNDMTVVMGLAEQVSDDTTGEAATAADRIADVAEEVAELGEKARLIETTLDAGRAVDTAVRIDPLLSSVVEECRERWPEASISLSVDGDPAVTGTDRELLEAALRNVVENALEHSDRDEPTVAITAQRAGGEVVVEVADDGPGIPEMERRVLQAGEESPMDHASGLGLWLAHWVATACGGSVTFEENEPRGSVVVFRFPGSDEEEPARRTATS